jgi:hypothetical protein
MSDAPIGHVTFCRIGGDEGRKLRNADAEEACEARDMA